MLAFLLISTQVLTASSQATNATIRCNYCIGARTLSDCTTLVACDRTLEECYMDQVITERLTVVYDGGCRAKDVCTRTGQTGKRSLVACSRCCGDVDSCNEYLCGIDNATRQTTPTPQVNPLHCQLCVRATDQSNCYGSVLCNKTTEECYMDKVITNQLTIEYNSGCRSKQICTNIASGKHKRDLVACSSCCSDQDNCNAHFCNITSGFQRTTKNITEGDALRMYCSTPSSGRYAIWSKVGSNITATGPDFYKRYASIDDSGQYTCTFGDLSGRTAMQHFQVTVNKRPKIKSPLKCRVCERATELSDCNKVLTCDRASEDCYMDELITDQLSIVYEGGCRPKDVCSRSGRRRSELVACSRCCSFEEDCNKRLCGIKNSDNFTIQVSEGGQFLLNCSDVYMPRGQNVSWTKVNGCGRDIATAKGPLYHKQRATVVDSGEYICSYDRFGRTITQTFHVNVTSSKQQQACTFDGHSLCGWQQGHSDDFDWTLISGSTQSSGTGPSVDHTTGLSTGTYLYIESSAPRTLGDRAVLESTVQPANQTRCFEFWYYMYGDGTGGLYVSVQDTCLHNDTQVFRQVGEQGARWNKASVTIPNGKVPNDYRIVIKADVGNTYHGDTSIDDLIITNGNCTGHQGAAIVEKPESSGEQNLLGGGMGDVALSIISHELAQ